MRCIGPSRSSIKEKVKKEKHTEKQKGPKDENYRNYRN